jgi:hypothetical protein
MRRTLRGAVGVVLAIGAVLPAWPASAQSTRPNLWYQSSPTQWNQSSPIRKVQYEAPVVLHEAHSRLEEMKVELALLSDIATFPYYIGARATGDTLALRGYVPNDMVRQRVLEIARRSTFLTVKDELKAQKNLSLRPSLRPAETLQEEGMEMLRKKLGEPARQMTLTARPNGIVVLKGRIDSVESKVEISRLFRQLSGCFGIVNELIVEQVLRDGQRVVQVTRDGTMLVAPSALGLEPEMISTPSSIPAVVKPTPLPETHTPTYLPDKTSSASTTVKPMVLPSPRPTLPPPTPLPRRGLDAQDGELRLPNPSKPANGQPKATPENQGTSLEALIPPQLPTKWSQPATNRKSQEVKRQASPTATTLSGTQAKIPTVPSSPIRWIDTKKPTPTAATTLPGTQAKEPTVLTSPSRWADTKKPTLTADVKKPTPTVASKKLSPTVFAESHPATADMSWHSPKGSEEAEQNTPVATQKPEMPSRITPPSPSVAPSRRWPPAYESHSSHSSESNGRPGLITFDDDPPPAPKPSVVPMGSAHPIIPSNLQRQVKSVCGGQARDVAVEVQRDGAVLVKVKVPNQFVESQLTKKILAIPEMTSPKVRLMMDVGP